MHSSFPITDDGMPSLGFVDSLSAAFAASSQGGAPDTALAVAGAPPWRLLDDASGQASASLSISHNSVQGKLNVLQGSHKRMAEVVCVELIALAKAYGIERLGFFTLTFSGKAPSVKEAMRKFNNLCSNILKKRYVKGVRVLERGEKNGRLHFHCVVVLAEDIRTGFDFAGIARGDYSSANAFLRGEWAFWRETAPRYGFGRTELLPVRSTAEGIARYVGAYVGKHVRGRVEDDKGARLVGFWGYRQKMFCAKTGSESWYSCRKANSNFAFNTIRSQLWRHKVMKWAARQGVQTMEELQIVVGPRWCFWFMDEIMMETIDDAGLVNVPEEVVQEDNARRQEIAERENKRIAEREWLQHDKWDKQHERALRPIKEEARQICRDIAKNKYEE